MDLLHAKRVEHHKKYMIHYDDIKNYDLKEIFPLGCTFVCDTESSFLNENKNIPLKLKKEVFENELQPNGEYKKVKKLKSYINPKFDTEVHVYAWGLGCDFNDYCVYGEDLNDLFNLFNDITLANMPSKMPHSEKGYRKLKSDFKYKCFIHNLGWDIEFCKYTLKDRNLEYKLSKVSKKSKKKVREKGKPSTFNIVENNNIVYSANVTLEELDCVRVKKKLEDMTVIESLPVYCEIEFLDSYKILTAKLEDIANKILTIDDCFRKMSKEYDYETPRLKGHKLTELERHYLYNDIYILKEFINQFYKKLNTNCVTASAIAFEKYINITYGENGYKGFLEDFPDLSNYSYIWSIIKNSYKGGWTQANKLYRGKTVKCNGVSIDINSSYPYSVAYCLLPMGFPTLYEGFKECKPDKEVGIVTIHFDGFKNKNEDDLIGNIQVGAISSAEFGLNGTEYIHTNFKSYEVVDNNTLENCEVIGTNGKSTTHRYSLSLWDFELENLLETMEFYTEVKKYDPIREFNYSTGTFKKGYHVENTLIFKAKKGVFKKAVEYYNNMKIQGKELENAVMTNEGKLSNNSFYGKLASNYIRLERNLTFDEKGLAQFETTDNIYNADRKYYPAFASAVTAWSRINLRTTLYKVGYNNVLYFDTDSLYTTLTKPEIVAKCGDILNKTELGKWDVEKEYTQFKSLGAKKYILFGRDFIEPEKIKIINGKEYMPNKKGEYVPRKENKLICKCAGLPKDVRDKQDFDTFKLGATFEGKKVRTKCKGGFALIEGEFKIHNNSYF